MLLVLHELPLHPNLYLLLFCMLRLLLGLFSRRSPQRGYLGQFPAKMRLFGGLGRGATILFIYIDYNPFGLLFDPFLSFIALS